MIQHKTYVKIVDNSGAKTALCIRILGGYKKKQAFIGDLILVAIQSLKTKINNLNIKLKTIFKALVIKTIFFNKKNIGIKFKFKNNSVILMDNQNNPLFTRINDFVSKKLKIKYYKLITISLNYV